MLKTGTALICSVEGNIQEIIRDNLKLLNKNDIGKSYLSLIDSDNLEKALNFQEKIKNNYVVCNWEIDVKKKNELNTILYLSGIISKKKLYLFIAESSYDVLKFFCEITRIYDIKIDNQKEYKTIKSDSEQQNTSSEFFDELSKMNNELISLQRQLAKKNYELNQLKNNLEERVEKGIKELQDKDRLLMIQSKQAAMGEMVSDIVHQWKQPLNGLALLIQDYEEAYEFEELDKEYIKKQQEKGMQLVEYMSQTMNDFRDFLNPNKKKIKFNLKDTVCKTLRIIEKILQKKNIQVKNLVEDYYVTGVENELIQVIINIVNNAKDALLDNEIDKPEIYLKTSKNDDNIILEIDDNAGGIPDDIKDRIFQAYFTTKDVKGTGIGLYMSKMIMEQTFNGKLRVTNKSDGASFALQFPK